MWRMPEKDIFMELYETLKERIDKMESGVAEKDEKYLKAISDIDKRACLTEEILKRLEETNKDVGTSMRQLGDVMGDFKLTMVDMRTTIDNNVKATADIKTKIDKLETKMEENEKRASINWIEIVRDFLKSKLFWFVTVFIFISLLFYDKISFGFESLLKLLK